MTEQPNRKYLGRLQVLKWKNSPCGGTVFLVKVARGHSSIRIAFTDRRNNHYAWACWDKDPLPSFYRTSPRAHAVLLEFYNLAKVMNAFPSRVG